MGTPNTTHALRKVTGRLLYWQPDPVITAGFVGLLFWAKRGGDIDQYGLLSCRFVSLTWLVNDGAAGIDMARGQMPALQMKATLVWPFERGLRPVVRQ